MHEGRWVGGVEPGCVPNLGLTRYRELDSAILCERVERNVFLASLQVYFVHGSTL